MKILLIEDEEPACKRIEKLLAELEFPTEIVGSAASVSDAVVWLQTHEQPDLIFMDIRLADGLSFEIFDLVEVKSPVIFTTAYDEYALRAFKVNSVDYLLKPIDRDELRQAIEKYEANYSKVAPHEEMAGWIRSAIQQLGERYKRRFFVKVGQHYRSVPVEEIECFYINEKCTFLMTTKAKSVALDHSLDQLGQLVDPSRFFRVNRNFLVHFSEITDIVIYSGTRLKLKLKNGQYPAEILVSRDRVQEFKRWMDR